VLLTLQYKNDMKRDEEHDNDPLNTVHHDDYS
jgi:hypothetical protein